MGGRKRYTGYPVDFSVTSTPKTDGTFNVYDDVRNVWWNGESLKEQIAFIHEYNTEVKKAELFAKVRCRAGKNPDGFHSNSVLVPMYRTDYLHCII